MCQAIADGGRRCPRHRRDSIVAMQFAASESGLPLESVNELFTELRREARHVQMHGIEDSYDDVITTLQEQARDTSAQRYRDILAEYDQDSVPAADTLYALTRIRRRSIEQSTNLNNQLGEISEQTHTSPVEVRSYYETARAEASNATAADEHDMESQEASFERDIPTDPASITAFARTVERFSLGERGDSLLGEQDRVFLDNSGHNGEGSSRIEAYAYHSETGRLEVYSSNNRTLAYRNVSPRDVRSWRTPQDAHAGIMALMHEPHHRYTTPMEADRAGRAYRCDACGQFRALSHECPEREVIDEIMAGNPERDRYSISNDEVAAILDSRAAEATAAAEEVRAGEAAEDEAQAEAEGRAPESENETLALQNGVTPAPDLESGTSVREMDLENAIQIPPETFTELSRKSISTLNEVSKAHLLRRIDDFSENLYGTPSAVEYVTGGLTRAEVESAPEGTMFLLGTSVRRYYDDNGHRVFDGHRVVDTYISPGYDHNERFITSELGIHRRENSGYTWLPPREESSEGFTVPMARRGIVNPTRYADYDEFVTANNLAQEAFNREHGDSVVAMESVSNYSRAYAIRAEQTSRIAWAKKPQFRRAINDGKVAVAPLVWTEDDGGAQVDEFGYDIDTTNGFTVSGNLGMKRNDDGTFEVVTPDTSLRCDCPVYRRNYHCTHIDYVRNHAPKMGQQMMQTTPRQAPAEGRYGVPVSVSNHRGAQVGHDEETNHTSVSFTENPNGQYRPRHMPLSEETLGAERDVVTASRLAGLTSGMLYMPPPTIVERAGRNADSVSVPFVIASARDQFNSSSYWNQNYNMQGVRRLTRDENGEVTETVEQLRCSCGRFASNNGSCPHTELFTEHSSELLTSRTDFDDDDVWRQRRRIISDEQNTLLYDNSEAYMRLANGEITEAQLQDALRAAEEERERRAREYEAELARERAERRRRQEEERRRMALSMAERNAEDEAELLREVDYEGYRAGQKELWENVDERYGDNTEAVKTLIEEAQSQTGTIGEVVGYRTENVTDGVCDPNIPGSRRFGVELEFVLPSANKRQKLNAIARELHEEGLSDRPSMGGYHSGARSGWASWNLEEDCTVHGELVSPLMADTPEHWEQLNKAITILKKHGAQTSTKAGSHVHVSSGSFAGKLSKGVEVLRTVEENEDVLFRAAADPRTGAHRGTEWCYPNVSTQDFGDTAKDDYDNVSEWGPGALAEHMSHENMINMEGSVGVTKKAHIEYRMWDASLDAATIQKQVMASVAITESADRTVENNDGVSHVRDVSADKKYGSAKRRLGQGKDVDETSLKNLTEFVDRVFRRKEDREDFIRLYATKSNA